MSVAEIIAQIKQLGPEELRQVKAAVDEAEAAADDELDDAVIARYQAAWDKLFSRAEPCGGKHLSANIDDALYGGDR